MTQAQELFARMLVAMMGPEEPEDDEWHKWERELHASYSTPDWGEIVDHLLAHAPEPEPDYDVPQPPDDWDDEDFPHYDTPGGW